jgi:hypothetical protein
MRASHAFLLFIASSFYTPSMREREREKISLLHHQHDPMFAYVCLKKENEERKKHTSIMKCV